MLPNVSIPSNLLLLMLVLLSGCGDGRAQPAPVTGVVTFQGQPVEGARVLFYPKGTRPAMGTTDAQGRFTLLTWEPGDGALEGESVVCVAKTRLKGSDDSPYAQGVSVLPEKYMAPSKSPLRAVVTADGPNEFKFELTN